MRHPDVEVIEDWNWTWVNGVTGMPISGAPTGSNPEFNGAVLRFIQNIYGKCVHRNCGGEIEVRAGKCETLQIPIRCRSCGWEGCAEI